jgi:hypothetical protein
MAGFKFKYRQSGGAPTIQNLLFKDTETLTKGDLVNLETGEVDLGATNDTGLLGIALETKAGTDSTTRIQVITDEDAVYEDAADANARLVGATLDISGATGAMALASSSNKDVVVVAESSATEPTLFKINPASSALGGTAIA